MDGRRLRPDRATGTELGHGTDRVRTPTVAQRLDRALEIVQASAPPQTAAGDEDDDPWPDVPEELEPFDDDGLDDPDWWPDGDEPLRPWITFSGSWVTIAPLRAVSDTPDAVWHARDDARRVAEALQWVQGAALAAQSLPEALERRVPMTQKELAEAAAADAPMLSRRRRELIETRWGVVPLEFFWWAPPHGLSVAEARCLLRSLIDEPAATDNAVATRAATSLGAPARTDAMRKQVPILRALLPLLGTLNSLSRRLVHHDFEDLVQLAREPVEAAVGAPLEKRGMGLVRHALSGAFVDMEAR